LVILSQILEINHWVAADAHSKVTKYVWFGNLATCYQ
jgi:hypothetical protein